MMKIQTFAMGQNFTNCYIVYDDQSKLAFCVDVCDHIEKEYFDFITQNSLKIQFLFLTHGHFDHTLDIRTFRAHFPEVAIVISKKDYQNILASTPVFCPPQDFVEPDEFAENGAKFDFCGSEIEVISTPGHTDGSVCYLFQNYLFCGDTVFAGSIGRTDLPTGSVMQLFASIKVIKQLGDFILYPGHMGESTLTMEKKYNPYFQ